MRLRSLGLILALTGGCKGKDPAGVPAPPPLESQAVDHALDNLNKVKDQAMALAAQEQQAMAAQTARHDRLAAETEALIEANDLDRAEIRASQVHWQPDEMVGSRVNDEMIKQYDERRATLQDVIKRKLGR